MIRQICAFAALILPAAGETEPLRCRTAAHEVEG